MFHVDLLTPFKETCAHGPNFPLPLPNLVDGEEEWEVDGIIRAERRGRNKNIYYLVSWKGFPASENCWVVHQDLSAPDLLQQFYNDNPLAPRPTLCRGLRDS